MPLFNPMVLSIWTTNWIWRNKVNVFLLLWTTCYGNKVTRYDAREYNAHVRELRNEFTRILGISRWLERCISGIVIPLIDVILAHGQIFLQLWFCEKLWNCSSNFTGLFLSQFSSFSQGLTAPKMGKYEFKILCVWCSHNPKALACFGFFIKQGVPGVRIERQKESEKKK